MRYWQAGALVAALWLGAATPQNTGHVGRASWYGAWHQNHRTADGSLFDAAGFTAASRTLPLGRHVRVCNLRNGLCVVVTVTDRGPYVRGRVIDLSRAAMLAIGGIGPGVVPVSIDPLP